MAADDLRPDTSTLTAVMHAIQTFGAWRQSREKALAAWREFRRLGVQPSLASYYCLISVFYRDREWSVQTGSAGARIVWMLGWEVEKSSPKNVQELKVQHKNGQSKWNTQYKKAK